MDFLIGFPRVENQYDSIWVVVDGLTKYAHFIPVKSTYSADDYARIFIDKFLCVYGIPVSILSNRGAQLTSRF